MTEPEATAARWGEWYNAAGGVCRMESPAEYTRHPRIQWVDAAYLNALEERAKLAISSGEKPRSE